VEKNATIHKCELSMFQNLNNLRTHVNWQRHCAKQHHTKRTTVDYCLRRSVDHLSTTRQRCLDTAQQQRDIAKWRCCLPLRCDLQGLGWSSEVLHTRHTVAHVHFTNLSTTMICLFVFFLMFYVLFSPPPLNFAICVFLCYSIACYFMLL